ncbi:hypothetical protein AAG570_000717 [Ranatra chinensis]|uniref:EF-hand domain-containing protein n=1 Tax=Ranatra chinensis TaxID=642074 RepID=A0ABD0ZL58_9HEMI
MFTKFSELTDVVSILPYCPEDGSWGLLRSYPETKRHKSICQEYRLISVKLLKSVCDAGSHWCSNGVLVKLLKIWLPQEAQENGPLNIHHAVFQMILTTREKASIQTDLSKMGELTWHKDLTALKGDMLTPEIIQYVNQEFCNRETATFLPEHFLRDNIVVELVKEDFLLNRDSDDPFDELVMSTGFSVEDEIGLYEQYLVHTFPYCTMGQGSFTKFMTNFGWSPEATNHLFKCADFEGRGALLPKELLYLMAALEPEVSLSPRSACIRGVYIFRVLYDHFQVQETS